MAPNDKARVLNALLRLDRDAPADDPDRMAVLGLDCFRKSRLIAEVQSVLDNPLDIKMVYAELQRDGYLTPTRTTAVDYVVVKYNYIFADRIESALAGPLADTAAPIA